MCQEEDVAVVAAVLCVIACASILGAREARKEQRRRRRRALRQGELHPNSRVGTPRQRLQESQEDSGGSDDSSEEDDSMSTTETSTSDESFSLDDDDDDDEPPPAEKQAATTKKAMRPFEMGESSSDVKIANDPLRLPKKASPPGVKSDDEDSGDDLIRAVPAKGKVKAVRAGKRKSLDNDDKESDAYIRPVKKNKTTARAMMTESFEKNPAGVKLASKITTVHKP
ncbi:hypothetical protein EDB89DRAFT_2234341 [Lactarius sanguifluus]|nr:hypothetical protein EDB89DRAFT_2234341 [Lactarius sanguifluus]